MKEKNQDKRLLEENRKLQQEYLDLIGQGMNNKKKKIYLKN